MRYNDPQCDDPGDLTVWLEALEVGDPVTYRGEVWTFADDAPGHVKLKWDGDPEDVDCVWVWAGVNEIEPPEFEWDGDPPDHDVWSDARADYLN